MGHGRHTSLWVRGRPGIEGPSTQQTRQLFDHLSSEISPYHGQLRDHVVRTWIYVRDIDNNYQGMVDARRRLFEKVGLTRASHFIASTGIEGAGERASDLMIMDSLAITGIQPAQLTFMTAPDFLCPTYEYNVTFERATRVTYGDRSHYYISGTASNDREGKILHPGNVIKQTERTLVNIQALLDGYGASAADLKQLVVYLRDVADGPLIRDLLKDALPPSLPWIMVRGAVCRPGWLVEIEGMAVSPFADQTFAPFCDPAS